MKILNTFEVNVSWWSNESVCQLSSTIVDYHEPSDRRFRLLKPFTMVYGFAQWTFFPKATSGTRESLGSFPETRGSGSAFLGTDGFSYMQPSKPTK